MSMSNRSWLTSQSRGPSPVHVATSSFTSSSSSSSSSGSGSSPKPNLDDFASRLTEMMSQYDHMGHTIFPWQCSTLDWMPRIEGTKKNRGFFARYPVLGREFLFSQFGLEDEDIRKGTAQAFKMAVGSIFNELPTKIDGNETKAETPAGIVTSELLNPNLAIFFKENIEVFAKNEFNSELLVKHHILDIEKCEIVDRDVIYGSCRDLKEERERQAKDESNEFKDVAFEIPSVMSRWLCKLLTSFVGITWILDEKSIASDLAICTVRCHVDLSVKELFEVANKTSGEITQGLSSPCLRKHRIILESKVNLVPPWRWESYPVPSENGVGDWTIVDIDFWLDRNEFWKEKGRLGFEGGGKEKEKVI